MRAKNTDKKTLDCQYIRWENQTINECRREGSPLQKNGDEERNAFQAIFEQPDREKKNWSNSGEKTPVSFSGGEYPSTIICLKQSLAPRSEMGMGAGEELSWLPSRTRGTSQTGFSHPVKKCVSYAAILSPGLCSAVFWQNFCLPGCDPVFPSIPPPTPGQPTERIYWSDLTRRRAVKLSENSSRSFIHAPTTETRSLLISLTSLQEWIT